MSTANASSFTTTLRISPEQIDINGLFHDNKWPDETPIHEIADEDSPREPGLLSDVAHGILDVAGMVPVVGELADGANALFYLAEGNKTDAALSAAAMIPIAGSVVGATKVGRRALKVIDKAKALSDVKITHKLKAIQKKVTAQLDKVAGHRISEGLPPYAPAPGSTGTVSHTRINGKDHFGYNSKIDDNFPRPDGAKRYSLSLEERREWFNKLKDKGLLKELRSLGDAQFLSHAEAETLIKAAREGQLPKVVDLYVDRATCNNCREYLPTLAKELGVEKLNLYYYLKHEPGYKHVLIDTTK